MQRRASAFNGYTIEATDGKVGSISDILFEDQTWKVRWFVINTGSWLMGRKILIHPAALQPPDIAQRAFPVSLTKLQVEESPDLRSDEPVSRQMDQELSDYYGYSSMWGDGYYGGEGISQFEDRASEARGGQTVAISNADNHQLLSVADTTGFLIHALDGDIGHLDDFLIDDETWTIEFAVVATKNWGFGKHVLISPADIKETNWLSRYVPVGLTRYKIRCSPSWQDPDWSDRTIS
jgi:hypothetical protein